MLNICFKTRKNVLYYVHHLRRAVIRLKRNAISELIRWKNSTERKPMVLKGARQVGKTWLMKEFGQNYYDNFVYFNFDEEDEMKSIFETLLRANFRNGRM